jgi:branched-chain amino acid transport system substrate-binding protein
VRSAAVSVILCAIVAPAAGDNPSATGSAAAPAPADRPPDPATDAGPVASSTTASSAPGTPGVTANEILIGQTMPYSGPVSAYGAIGKAEAAYFKMINDAGGINGRKIVFISLDDAYVPPKTVERTRRLVEEDGVAVMFGSVGSATNIAVRKYLHERGVPQLFVASARDDWADPQNYPWTIGWQPSYRIEARIYGRYLLAHKPNAKICVLYQNDDFGRDHLTGLKDALGAKHDRMVTKLVSYEVTDPLIDTAIDELWVTGCDTLIAAATPKFAAQAIRKVSELGWQPMFFVSSVSTSLDAVLKPAGLDRSTGIITGSYLKDPTDPASERDPNMVRWRSLMEKFLPDANLNDINYLYGYAMAQTMVQVLKQCGKDLSRRNIMKQAANLRHFRPSVVLDGVELNTSAKDFRPISQLRLVRFNGATFERFSNLLSGD